MSQPYLYWVGLSVIFAFLSLDEAVRLHERLSNSLRINYNLSGFFYYSWVIPYGIFVFLFLGCYIKFLLVLPKKIAKLFICSGVIYVSGCIGMEMIGGHSADKFGYSIRNWIYITVEETLEMTGIALFIYALVLYIHTQKTRPDVEIAELDSVWSNPKKKRL